MLNATKLLKQSQTSRTMATLSHIKVAARRSNERGHGQMGWLDTYHTFPFASHGNLKPDSWGQLRVLNEDRVAPKTGFPTHTHRDYEIFSYVLSGQLTHRDSIKGRGSTQTSDAFSIMSRGDVQFTTGGTGIAHSEQNENENDWVHFLQIWVKPWAQGLPPVYHTSTFDDEAKRAGFVTLITPLAAGPGASTEAETSAVPAKQGTIPIHADFVMGASIIPAGSSRTWKIGGDAVKHLKDRKVYVHLPTTKNGQAKIRVNGEDGIVLNEGDGAFVSNVNAGDELVVESIGNEEAEIVVLDSN